MKAEPIQCECCEDELGQVFALDITFGPVCNDCSEGMYYGRRQLSESGIIGIAIQLPPTR